jgi:hypothetical protein
MGAMMQWLERLRAALAADISNYPVAVSADWMGENEETAQTTQTATGHFRQSLAADDEADEREAIQNEPRLAPVNTIERRISDARHTAAVAGLLLVARQRHG